MNRLHLLAILFLALLVSCKSSDDKLDSPISLDQPFPKSTLIGRYKTKPPKELFFTDRMLKLNNDSTFSYRSWTCVGIDTCHGKWNLTNSMILLKTSKELQTEIAERTVINDVRLVDLNNHYVIIRPDYLLLHTYGIELDTLIKE